MYEDGINPDFLHLKSGVCTQVRPKGGLGAKPLAIQSYSKKLILLLLSPP